MHRFACYPARELGFLKTAGKEGATRRGGRQVSLRGEGEGLEEGNGSPREGSRGKRGGRGMTTAVIMQKCEAWHS